MSDEIAAISEGQVSRSPSDFVHDPEGYTLYLLGQVETMHDNDLEALAGQAHRLGLSAYIVRAACIEEILRRVPKLHGSPGNKAKPHEGQTNTIKDIAAKLDVYPRTLQADLEIYKTFFLTSEEEILRLCQDETEEDKRFVVNNMSFIEIGREFLRFALMCENCWKAIIFALKQRAKGRYTVKQFDEDTKKLGMRKPNSKKSETKSASNPVDESINSDYLKLSLNESIAATLSSIISEYRGLFPTLCASPEALVSHLVLNYSLLCMRDERNKLERSENSGNENNSKAGDNAAAQVANSKTRLAKRSPKNAVTEPENPPDASNPSTQTDPAVYPIGEEGGET